MTHGPLFAVASVLFGSVVAQRNASQEAALTDPYQQCNANAYNLAPFDQLAPLFPTIWQIASIVPGDTAAQNLYNQISPNIPNIPPRGTPDDNPSVSFSNYSSNDPDCWWSFSRCTKPKLPGLPPDVASCNDPNTWGLSFDDGPNCSHNAFYDFLRAKNQTATLFYIGSNVMNHPFQAQNGLNDGHIIGVHTWSHRAMCSLTNEQVFAELYYSLLAIKSVIGVTPRFWRPPFGDVDDRVRYIADQLGMRTMIWLADTNDYAIGTIGAPAVEKNYNTIFANEASGAYNNTGPIVLTHELTNGTMQMFEIEYQNISKHFEHILPAHVCANAVQPYLETQYAYPNASQYIAGTTTISAFTATASAVSSLSNVSTWTSASGISGSVAPSASSTKSSASVGTPTSAPIRALLSSAASQLPGPTSSSTQSSASVQIASLPPFLWLCTVSVILVLTSARCM